MADHARATITIDAAPAEVMAVIADVGAYPSWSGPVERTEVVKETPDGRPARAKFWVDAKITKDQYTLDYTWAGDRSVSWVLVEGQQQTAQQGSYTLAEQGTGTEVTYDLSVELKIKIPGLLRRRFQSGVMDAALKDLKKRIESSADTSAETSKES
jgi:ribosome-associated toxin RatA of RatAB toxin-antitoxin module